MTDYIKTIIATLALGIIFVGVIAALALGFSISSRYDIEDLHLKVAKQDSIIDEIRFDINVLQDTTYNE